VKKRTRNQDRETERFVTTKVYITFCIDNRPSCCLPKYQHASRGSAVPYSLGTWLSRESYTLLNTILNAR
jgi:hypothetical protein